MKIRIGIISTLSLIALLTASRGLLQAPQAASSPIEAIPLDIDTEAVEQSAPVSEGGIPLSPTEVSSGSDGVDVGSESLNLFQISQAESQVRFELNEDLRGQRKTVVGTTDQVAGEIAFMPSDLPAARVDVIIINARTLVTDNSFRNRAIQNQILDTAAYEFITFEPKEILGLPSGSNIDDELKFSIVGEMTIRDISQLVGFEVSAAAASETQLAGSASAVISCTDYNLTIPSVPNVANVEEEVELYIDFVANRQ